jgi:hypothetical protein
MTLDAAVYPHILDRVLFYAPYPLLLRLRSVSRALRDAADEVLFQHVVFTAESVKNLDETRGSISSILGILPASPVVWDETRNSVPSILGMPPALRVAWQQDAGTTRSYTLPPHSGWAHTRVLDVAREIDSQHAVHSLRSPDQAFKPDMVRCRGPRFTDFLAPTHLDVLRVPRQKRFSPDLLPGVFRYAAFPSAPAVAEHVMVLLYDPAWRGSWGWGQWDMPLPMPSVDGVLVFRPAPLPGPIPPHPEVSLEPFLTDCLFLIVQRRYKSCTIVGLEGLPSHHLAVLGLSDEEMALADSDDARWVETVAAGVRKWMHVEGFKFDPRARNCDYIEVLTMDAYRARVGEERFRLTTFSDGIPPHMDP